MTLLGILVMAATLFLLRISGFLLADAKIPDAFERALRFTPIATLTAVTVAILMRSTALDPIGLTALSAGALAAWKVRQLWLCIVVGIGVALALRLVTG